MVRDRSGAYLVRPVGNATEAADAGYRANEIVVTAQKRVESIQDVPIAMTALSQKNLEEQKIESGADIMRAVPNLTRSDEHTSELQSLMRISYTVFCLTNKIQQ